jgi:hypothetical protein
MRPAEEVLEEVLSALGRARVRLEREDLLAHEGREHPLDLGLRNARHRGQRTPWERLSHHRRVLNELAFFVGPPSMRAATESMEVS